MQDEGVVCKYICYYGWNRLITSLDNLNKLVIDDASIERMAENPKLLAALNAGKKNVR